MRNVVVYVENVVLSIKVLVIIVKVKVYYDKINHKYVNMYDYHSFIHDSKIDYDFISNELLKYLSEAAIFILTEFIIL